MIMNRVTIYGLAVISLAFIKGLPEFYGVPLFIPVFLTIICTEIFLRGAINFRLPGFLICRIFLGIWVILHGALWDAVIGGTYIIGALMISIIWSSKELLNPGQFIRFLWSFIILYMLSVFTMLIIQPDFVYALDRGIDLRFVGLAGDPNFLAILTFIVVVTFFPTRKSAWLLFMTILIVTASRSALIISFIYLVQSSIKKSSMTQLFMRFFLLSCVTLFLVVNYSEEIFTTFRLDKLEQQSRFANLWYPVILSLDWTEVSTHIWGQGSLYAKNILGVYLHSSWLEIFIEYGVLGLALSLFELYFLWATLKKLKARFILVSFVILNALFSVHWGIMSTALLSIAIMVNAYYIQLDLGLKKNEISIR